MNEDRKIMVGIFSYNEGENLENMYNQIRIQSIGLSCEIVLADESNEKESVDIRNKIMEKYNVRNICKTEKRKGKVYGYNALYDSFLTSDCDILIHFDADHVLSENAVSGLVDAIQSGYNIATCLNKPLKAGNLFQRILNVLSFPATYLRETGEFKYPLVGHNGAYDKKAVQCIRVIPSGGSDEETFILGKVLQNNLKSTVVTQSVSYYSQPSNLNDYMRGTKRMYSKTKTAIMRYPEVCQVEDMHGNHTNVVDMIYSRPPMKVILKGILSDPFASLFVPYVMLVRLVVMKTAGIYISDTWETIESTKRLKV